MNFVKVISTEIDSLKRRVIKVLRFGKSDVQTAIECSPYGVDSNPIKDMVAVYGETTEKGKVNIIGYINKNQKAGVGELRLFSTDSDGVEKFYTWLKSDGTIEIGGNSNFAVKYNELETEFNKLKTNFNNHLTEYNTHTHAGVTSGGSSTGITTPSSSINTSDITQAKNDKIKTI